MKMHDDLSSKTILLKASNSNLFIPNFVSLTVFKIACFLCAAYFYFFLFFSFQSFHKALFS